MRLFSPGSARRIRKPGFLVRETRIYVSHSCFSVFSPGWSVELVRGVLQPPIFQHFALVAEVQGFRKGFFPPNSGCQMDASPQVYTCLENRGFTPQIGPGFFKKKLWGHQAQLGQEKGSKCCCLSSARRDVASGGQTIWGKT